ncbi:MAG TPA: hypothetical protein VHK27_04080 [Gammaproteobacteria bacterium]|nr:hypothetical protein [Gammaproteobacteria bacterium]
MPGKITTRQMVAAEQTLLEIAANVIGEALIGIISERTGNGKPIEECTRDEMQMRRAYHLLHTALKLMADVHKNDLTVVGKALSWHGMVEVPGKGQFCRVCGPRGGQYPCQTVRILRGEDTI